ncbi:dihydroorotase [Halomonas sp. 328]|uniref:dihydroorotase n=1 Tax=Halomonas sp. 328 TaxID=2776704 RepID=UPI0018A7ABBF|nr:dihydroorotase [Halomonas sp. 328]MBF8223164.1 dihydroorotase [Halomonas sp. 328]
MNQVLIRNARLVNEGEIREGDLLVRDGRIARIAPAIDANAEREIEADGAWLLPGMIDDQVHFRDPGAPHKGNFASESRAAVAGGITSVMDMPNTQPPTLDLTALEAKERRAAATAWTNYGFHFGVSHDNLDRVAALPADRVAAVKVFMGASTGDMLVDDPVVLERLFATCPTPLLAHCEDTPRIQAREAEARARFGEAIPAEWHPWIRDHEACYRSSSLAVALARRHGTRLHVLHLTTARELALFEAGPVSDKRITAEVCLHHLLFDEGDYADLGHRLKCNPAVKGRADRDALRRALVEGRLDIIGTDHAPHALAEKQRPYVSAPAGLPLVEHALPALMELVADGVLPLETLVAKTSHAVAERFDIVERGYLREGYWADLALLGALPTPRAVAERPVLAHCGWTPFAGWHFRHEVVATLVSGQLAWYRGRPEASRGRPLRFAR